MEPEEARRPQHQQLITQVHLNQVGQVLSHCCVVYLDDNPIVLTTIVLQKTYHSKMSITYINDPTVSKTSRNHNLFKFKVGLGLVNSSVWAVVLNRRDEGTWNISEYSIASQNDDMP